MGSGTSSSDLLRGATDYLPDSSAQDLSWVSNSFTFFSNIGKTVTDKLYEFVGGVGDVVVRLTGNGTKLPDANEVVGEIQNQAGSALEDAGINIPGQEQPESAPEIPTEQQNIPEPIVESEPQIIEEIQNQPSDSLPDVTIDQDAVDPSDVLDVSANIDTQTLADWILNNSIIGVFLGNTTLSDAAGLAFVSLIVVCIACAIFGSLGGGIRYVVTEFFSALFPEGSSKRTIPFWITYPGLLIKVLVQLIAATLTRCKINKVAFLPVGVRAAFANDNNARNVEYERTSLSDEQKIAFIMFTLQAKKEKVREFQSAMVAFAPTLVATLISMLIIYIGCSCIFAWWSWIIAGYFIFSLLMNCGMSIDSTKRLFKSPLVIVVLLFVIFLFIPIDTSAIVASIFPV